MKKALPLLICFLWLITQWNNAEASHIVGGEMSYVCLGDDQYEITLKVYRDCFNGLAPFDNPTSITIYNANGVLVSGIPGGNPVPITLPGSDTLNNNPGNPCLIVPPGICVEEAVFITTVTLPPFPGGYTLVYQRCCRNIIVTNILTPDQVGASYVATIPDTSLAVCNSSPIYVNFPPTVICVDLPFSFDHSAFDADGDSLVYQLCAPFIGGSSYNAYPLPALPPPYTFVQYVAPYTATDPMGGNPPMAIDAASGLLTVTPNTIGNFVVGICVEEYRNGNLLAEHKRDFQFNVVECTPAVVASIPNVINNCTGYTVNFVNNSFGGFNYHWDFGITGITTDTSNLFEPTFTFPDTGIYTVTLIVNPGTACGDTTTAQVYIYPTFTGAISVPDGCQGQTIQFGDLSTATFGTVDSWSWKFGDGGLSSLQNPSHTYGGTGTFTVELIVGTSTGCADTVTEEITIYPSPSTNVQPSDTTICYLDFVQLTATGTGHFSWSPDYNLSNDTISNPTAGPDVTTTYTLTLSNDFGCFVIDSVTIHVFDTVIVFAGNDTTICPGESIQLTGIGGVNFQWSPATGLSSSTISNPVASPTVTTTYVLTSSVGSCFGTDAVTISVKPFPVIQAGPDQTICEGDSIQISASGVTSYSWTPSSSLSDANVSDPIAFPSSTTTYIVTGTDSAKCNKIVSDSLTVTVLPMPVINISADTTIFLGTCTELSITGGGTYQWIPADGLDNPNDSMPTACPEITTYYHVIITSPLGCIYEDSVLIIVDPEPLLIFPSAFSPNEDGKNDVFRPVILGLATLDEFRIFDRWGVMIFEVTGLQVSNVTGAPLDYSYAWDGTYKGNKQPVGVYVYYLKGRGTATGTSVERQGNVTLIR